MSNEMFTQLPVTSAATMTDIICAVQGYVSTSNPGISVQETLQQVYNLFQSNVILYNAGNPNGSVVGSTYQLCWDTTNHILYVCTTSGSSSTAVWTKSIELTAGSNIVVSQSGNTITVSAAPTLFNSIVVQTFTTSGTYTPTTGMSYCQIEGLGAGGGGGGTVNSGSSSILIAGGGGAGSFSRITVSAATIGSSQVVTVGTGGTGGSAGNNNGGAGGNSSVGSIWLANGGSGGSGNNTNSPLGGVGGAAGIGDIAGVGAKGGPGLSSSINTFTIYAGVGANTAWGDGGTPVNGGAPGLPGSGFGAGGSGGGSSNASGGSQGGTGAPGYVIITEYVN